MTSFLKKISKIGNGSKSTFNNPLILKSYPVENGSYKLTIAFTGSSSSADNPFLYQVTEFKAIPYQDHFRFYCDFEENTRHFKVKKIDNVNYHFSGAIDEKKAKEFVNLIGNLSKWAKIKKPTLDYYAFQSLDELLKSYGFLFSARQCNFLCYDLGFTDNNGRFYMTGTKNENYIFGYIEDFLYYNLPNKENLYSTYVTGIAAYYGGYGWVYLKMSYMKIFNVINNMPLSIPYVAVSLRISHTCPRRVRHFEIDPLWFDL